MPQSNLIWHLADWPNWTDSEIREKLVWFEVGSIYEHWPTVCWWPTDNRPSPSQICMLLVMEISWQSVIHRLIIKASERYWLISADGWPIDIEVALVTRWSHSSSANWIQIEGRLNHHECMAGLWLNAHWWPTDNMPMPLWTFHLPLTRINFVDSEQLWLPELLIMLN